MAQGIRVTEGLRGGGGRTGRGPLQCGADAALAHHEEPLDVAP